MDNITKRLERNDFEGTIARTIQLDQLDEEFSLCFRDSKGSYEIKTCYGDIRKIVDALMDYANILEKVCVEWKLEGFHRATYELHAEKLRDIAKKYQIGIGYDYEKALEKCRKKKKQKESDIGDDALSQLAKKYNNRDKASKKTDT